MPPQASRLTSAARAELRRRDAQTEAILAQLAPPRDSGSPPSLRDILLPRQPEVADPTDAQRAAHEARVRDTQADWGPVRRGVSRAAEFAGEHVPEFLSGALWGDPTVPDASRANLLGQMLTAGLPIAAGIKRGLRTGRDFFSRVDDAIDLIPVKGAHPNKVASLLSRASKDELEYRGVPAFLAAQGNTPVTREALRAHLQAHPAPFPVVRTAGDQPLTELPEGYSIQRIQGDERAPFALIGPTPAHDRFLPQTRNADEALEDALSIMDTERNLVSEYAQYQVPGGTNYRETVLTLPGVEEALPRGYRVEQISEGPQAGLWQMFDDKGYPTGFADRTRQGAVRSTWGSAVIDTPVERGIYRSGHFDDPNILVHSRSNERTLPTGERGRFLEEVQSDWHQAGKAKGYQGESMSATFEPSRGGASTWRVTDDKGADLGLWAGNTADEAIGFAQAQRIPDAPFKDTWQDLGFKQQLLEVADDPTLDWIGWTSGKTQADRYDLSQQIGQVTARPTPDGRIHLDALTPDMGTQVINQVVDPGDLDGIIGKEISDKIRSGVVYPTGPSDMGTPVELSGLDLQVGGKGMVEFYDRLLPKRVAKIVKPFGGTVEQVSMGAGQPDQWIVRLTPEMKAKIKQGLPLLALPAGVQVSASRPEED